MFCVGVLWVLPFGARRPGQKGFDTIYDDDYDYDDGGDDGGGDDGGGDGGGVIAEMITNAGPPLPHVLV